MNDETKNRRCILEVKATYLRGFRSVGGHFKVTQLGAKFDPFKTIFHCDSFEIPFCDVFHVSKKNILRVFPTGMLIQFKNGRQITFTIEHRDVVVPLIQYYCEQLQQSVQL